MLAEQHSYIVLEMALRHRAKSEGLRSNSTLKPYLQLAIKRGWLPKEELDDRFHETGLDEASIHGTGIMFVDSSFEKS
jgi:hypothetical protein